MLIDFDRWLLLAVNGSESLYLDGVVQTLTNAVTWIPLYIALFYLVVKNNATMSKILPVISLIQIWSMSSASITSFPIQ